MKAPKTKTKSATATAAKLEETPLIDSWKASVSKGGTPGVFPIMWHNGFAVGHGAVRKFTREIRVQKYDSPFEHAGRKLFWAVEGVDYAEDGETVLSIWGQTWFETKEQADAFSRERVEVEKRKAKAENAAAEAHKPTSDEQDLAQARLKVMGEQYPDTFAAMDALAKAQPEARAEAVENLFRAYAVDLVRLHKPAILGEISPFKSLPTYMPFIVQLAKAYSAKSPHDPVDAEIAARWFAAGYDKMSKEDYTQAINAKTGTNISPDAMEKRRYAKLGLMTKKDPGPRPKS